MPEKRRRQHESSRSHSLQPPESGRRGEKARRMLPPPPPLIGHLLPLATFCSAVLCSAPSPREARVWWSGDEGKRRKQVGAGGDSSVFFLVGKRRGKAKCKIQRFGLASTGSFFNLLRRFLKSFEMLFCQCCCVLTRTVQSSGCSRCRTHECFAVSRLKDNQESVALLLLEEVIKM